MICLILYTTNLSLFQLTAQPNKNTVQSNTNHVYFLAKTNLACELNLWVNKIGTCFTWLELNDSAICEQRSVVDLLCCTLLLWCWQKSSIHQADQIINLQLTLLHLSMDELLLCFKALIPCCDKHIVITYLVHTHSAKCWSSWTCFLN